MADKSLLDLPQISDELKTTDELLANRGGVGGEKRFTGDRIVPTVVVQNTGTTIDLGTYFGDLVIFSNPASNITIALSNTLISGRKLTVVNKSSTYNVSLSGSATSVIPNNGLIDFVSDGSSIYEISATNSQVSENLLINGNFRFAQRGDSGTALFDSSTLYANNNNTYLLDHCKLISDGNDIVDVSQDTDVPNNKGLAMKSTVATGSKKWGYLLPIESEKCKDLLNNNVSLKIYAKTTSGKVINNIRIAVVSWDGTADTLGSLVTPGNWNASGVDPTLDANWTYENSPSNLALTTAYQDFVINGISIDTGGMKNIGLFIWVDDTDASAADELFIAECSLIKNNVITDVVLRDYGTEFSLCQRYFEKSYNLETAPGTITAVGKIRNIAASSSQAMHIQAFYAVSKRDTPTALVYSPSDGAINRFYDETTVSTALAGTSFASVKGHLNLTDSAATDGRLYSCHWTSESEL
jgi:hypothetical protein